MSLLFSFLLAASTAMSADTLKKMGELEKTNPHQALIEYKKHKHTYQHTYSDDVLQYHRIAIKSAIDLYDWESFLTILATLKSKEFEPFTKAKALNIINDIGVAYRQNNQFQDAIEHFTCALNKTTNSNYTAALKSNIATAYRVQGQPSVGFRLLNSIEHKVLDKNIGAGILIVKGNLALHINKIDYAISNFIEAKKLFELQNKLRDATRITFSIMSAALMKKDLTAYQTYRKDIETELRKFAIDNYDYLRFLDEVNHAIAIEDIPSLQSQHITDLVNQLVKHDDANENIRLLLKSLNLESLISPEQKRQPKEPILPSKLAANWCEGMK